MFQNLKPKFVSPAALIERQQRDFKRMLRRIPNRGPMDHATGEGFRADESTTKAVLKRMRSLGVIE